MNRQWKGIVFMDFRDENAPHFILNLIEELQREKIAESIAPCQTFAKSFMMISPATGRKDLVLLLRPLSDESMNRLENWRHNQGEQVVMVLSEYVPQYAPEFTGIGQLPKPNNSDDSENEQMSDRPSRKSKRSRRKSKQSSDQVSNDTENESDLEKSAIEDGIDTLVETEENQ
jgi:hypothetical protein